MLTSNLTVQSNPQRFAGAVQKEKDKELKLQTEAAQKADQVRFSGKEDTFEVKEKEDKNTKSEGNGVAEEENFFLFRWCRFRIRISVVAPAVRFH